jgi:hypothetical protein
MDQSEPGGPEKLLLLQSLAMSCIGLINDLAALHCRLKMEEENKLQRPRKCLELLIRLIRLFGGEIGRVDWLHCSLGADKKKWTRIGARSGEARSQPVEDSTEGSVKSRDNN